MSAKLDEKDMAILALIQEDNKLTAKQIAKKINAPITTVFAKTKRMEELDSWQGRLYDFKTTGEQDGRAGGHQRISAAGQRLN